jgi:hypothetical protein
MKPVVRKVFCLFILVTIGAHVLAANAVNEHAAAGLVIRNGAVYKVDAARSWASAVTVTGNRIVYVGTDNGVRPFVGAVTRVVDLRGRFKCLAVNRTFQKYVFHPIATTSPLCTSKGNRPDE